MAERALIKQEDAQRLAKTAKREGVAIMVRKDGFEIIVFPDVHSVTPEKEVEPKELEAL